MGYSNERSIEIHNERMVNDAEYAAGYENYMDQTMEEEAAYQFDLANERLYEYFEYRLIDYKGQPIELPEPEPVYIDDDIPF